jgi:hypothetical protein
MKTKDEAVKVHGRADYSRPARARGGIEDGRRLSQIWHQQRHLLRVEGEVGGLDVSEAGGLKVLWDAGGDGNCPNCASALQGRREDHEYPRQFGGIWRIPVN